MVTLVYALVNSIGKARSRDRPFDLKSPSFLTHPPTDTLSEGRALINA